MVVVADGCLLEVWAPQYAWVPAHEDTKAFTKLG